MATGTRSQGASIELTLPAKLFDQLCLIAAARGLPDATAAARVGLAEWAAARQRELDDRDSAQKYFVNEALDELFAQRK